MKFENVTEKTINEDEKKHIEHRHTLDTHAKHTEGKKSGGEC